ncbi:60S ribosomal protein L14 [Gaertneriomyces sp. JEL0708]|nr:60S ribosomal protein L14 [Gaertneriomyces sp. JEL0708]
MALRRGTPHTGTVTLATAPRKPSVLKRVWKRVSNDMLLRGKILGANNDMRQIREELSERTYRAQDSEEVNELKGFVQSAFLAIFFTFKNGFLFSCDVSETDYRDRLIHMLIEPLFMDDTYPYLLYQRGERINQQRRLQTDKMRLTSECRGAGGWKHDRLIDIRLNYQWSHIFFLEVVGAPNYVDDQKRTDDQIKMLKVMQLSIHHLHNMLIRLGVEEDGLDFLESYGCLVYQRELQHYRMHRTREGLFLVDITEEKPLPLTKAEIMDHAREIMENSVLGIKVSRSVLATRSQLRDILFERWTTEENTVIFGNGWDTCDTIETTLKGIKENADPQVTTKEWRPIGSAVFNRFVEVGRVVMITYGPDAGKLAVVVEIIDHGRVLVDGPTTGVPRQAVSFKRATLTDLKINIPRGIGNKALKAAIEKQNFVEKWNQTAWAQKLAKRNARAQLTDLDRFKVMLARKKVSVVVGKAAHQLRKAAMKK